MTGTPLFTKQSPSLYKTNVKDGVPSTASVLPNIKEALVTNGRARDVSNTVLDADKSSMRRNYED